MTQTEGKGCGTILKSMFWRESVAGEKHHCLSSFVWYTSLLKPPVRYHNVLYFWETRGHTYHCEVCDPKKINNPHHYTLIFGTLSEYFQVAGFVVLGI